MNKNTLVCKLTDLKVMMEKKNFKNRESRTLKILNKKTILKKSHDKKRRDG